MKIDELQLAAFVRAYLFANNASQLFKQFASLIYENGISLIDEIDVVKEYEKFASEGLTNFESLVRAYAILVAATNLDFERATEIINKLDLSLLQWGSDIKNIYQQSRRSTNIIRISGPQLQIQTSMLNMSLTATNREDVI